MITKKIALFGVFLVLASFSGLVPMGLQKTAKLYGEQFEDPVAMNPRKNMPQIGEYVTIKRTGGKWTYGKVLGKSISRGRLSYRIQVSEDGAYKDIPVEKIGRDLGRPSYDARLEIYDSLPRNECLINQAAHKTYEEIEAQKFSRKGLFSGVPSKFSDLFVQTED